MYPCIHARMKNQMDYLLNQLNQALYIILAIRFQIESGDDKHMSPGMFTFIIGKKN